MPVDTIHPKYTEALPVWERCRDAVAGSDAVKAKDDTYLPCPTGYATSDARYKAYKTRAKWLGATAKTVEGMEGEVTRIEPVLNIPDQMTPIIQNVTLTGIDFAQYARKVLRERLTVGRCGSLVDWSDTLSRPFIRAYTAEEIVNWRVDLEKGYPRINLVVLAETYDVPEDEFTTTTGLQYRVARLVDGVCIVQVYRTDAKSGEFFLFEERVPSISGRPLTSVPFVFHGVLENDQDIEKPPILDLADVNFSDYRNSADLEQGRHYCGLPQFYWFGREQVEDEVSIGTGVWQSTNPQASAGVVEMTGAALSALEKARTENRIEMSLLGARLFEETKMTGETADAIRQRQGGKMSVLQAMATTQDQAHVRELTWIAEWMGLPTGSIDVVLNKDFTLSRLAPDEIRVLLEAVQAGHISPLTLFENLQAGEIIPRDRTFEEEQDMIDAATPDLVAAP